MSALQLFLLGIMVAWTPSLIFLALTLSRPPEAEFEASQNR